MTDGPRFPWVGWMQASISISPCLRRTWSHHHYGIGRTWTHWRYSVSSDEDPWLGVSDPIHDDVAHAPKLTSGSRQDTGTGTAATSRFITVRSVVCLPKRILRRGATWNGPSWPYEASECLPRGVYPALHLIRSTVLFTEAQDFTGESFHHAQNSCYLELRCVDNKTISCETCFGKFRCMRLPITRENRMKIVLETQVVISRQSALGFSPKMTTPGLFLSRRPRDHRIS